MQATSNAETRVSGEVVRVWAGDAVVVVPWWWCRGGGGRGDDDDNDARGLSPQTTLDDVICLTT